MKVFQDLEKENYYFQVKKGEIGDFKKIIVRGMMGAGLEGERDLIDAFGALYMQILALEINQIEEARKRADVPKLAISNSQLKGEFFTREVQR